MTKIDIRLKRVYDPVEEEDGFRVLVDRIWPRGMTKVRLKADLWLKDVAPSTDLRKWFNHEHSRWEEFKSRYFFELREKSEMVNQLCDLAAKGRVTLLFSASDNQYNQAVALREYLMNMKK
ncbi:MAG TPA: DUF488 family protein [Syntrophorhabdaceae bacterium]|jgi:uncharacterized protein YeaO (DUF488 family)|nr:DUF488 family protein [Syntrophorhabdaceae bacterium]